MPCKQDADLLRLGIQIDKFAVSPDRPADRKVVAFMLTHAHTDHMKDLKANFGERHRHQARIFATQVTSKLAMIAVKGLAAADFAVIEPYQPFHPAPDVTCWAFPAYHCDGSCMFLFEIEGRTRVLYTGDFRWNPEIRNNNLLMGFTIDRLYYDDFFDEVMDDYPSHAESYNQLRKHVVDLMDSGTVEKICVNTSVLGIEPLLRELSDELGIRFSLSRTLRATWRGQQLEYLLEHRISCDDTKFMLGVAKFDDEENDAEPWIIPTCTYFLCGAAHKERTPRPHIHVQFCTHSNNKENTHLKVLIAAKQVNPCGEAVRDLTCAEKVSDVK